MDEEDFTEFRLFFDTNNKSKQAQLFINTTVHAAEVSLFCHVSFQNNKYYKLNQLVHECYKLFTRVANAFTST